MSNVLPQFATAPRIKLYVDNTVVAYAVGYNVAVSVDIQPVFVIGQYEPVALEPTLYNTVTGTFQIVRLLSTKTQQTNIDYSNAKRTEIQDKELTGAAPSQTAIASPGGTTAGSSQPAAEASFQTNDVLNQQKLFKHLDPRQLLLSKTFNVQLHMKVPSAAGLDGSAETLEDAITEIKWFEIMSCRFTSRNTNIAMGQLVNTPLSFQGLMASPTDSAGNRQFRLDSTITNAAPVA